MKAHFLLLRSEKKKKIAQINKLNHQSLNVCLVYTQPKDIILVYKSLERLESLII